MPYKFFVAGTDTHVGKTYISLGLLKIFRRLGYSTLGIKPVATGGTYQGDRLFNDDALALQQASTVRLAYEHINPFVFEPAIAPHIAASYGGITLSSQDLIAKMNFSSSQAVDIVIIEGIGGWHVPLNNAETMADFVKNYRLPAILVVAIRLGCLNHALLSYEAIKTAKIPLIGWIANCIEPVNTVTFANIDTLKNWLKAPYLGTVLPGEQPENALNIHPLIQTDIT